MREILFRGKRKNGEWVQGCYILWNGKHCIYDDVIYYEFLPETIGQYTGLTDKNGTKIFEGDVIVYNDDVRYGVFWSESEHAFYIEGIGYTDLDRLGNLYGFLCEVIGNIHDNPELLKSEVQGE